MLVRICKALGLVVVSGVLVDCSSEGAPSLGQRQGQVSCSSVYGRGGGRDLVDPPGSCTMEWSSCSDGHTYGLDCDGLGCVCSFDGVPEPRMTNDASFLSPRCPNINEAGSRCGWPIGYPPGSGGGGQALQGMPCDDGLDFDEKCECSEGLWYCPGLGGCNVIGKHVPLGEELPLIDFRPDGTFYVADVTASASFDEVVVDEASGFYGTWVLSGDVIGLLSYHGTNSEICSAEVGRYGVTFDDECGLLELRPLEDNCKPRRVVGAALEPVQ